jgi:hypothetical protein
VGNRRLHARLHLRAMNEDPRGVPQRIRCHAAEPCVGLEGVFQLAAMRHDGVWNSLLFLDAFGHAGNERRVIGVQRGDAVSPHDIQHHVDVPLHIPFEHIVGQVDHGRDHRMLLVPIPDEDGQHLVQHRLVHDALAGVRRGPAKQLRHRAVHIVAVRFGDTVERARMRLLTHELHVDTLHAERFDDAARPQVAARTIEQISVHDADHLAVASRWCGTSHRECKKPAPTKKQTRLRTR